MAARFWQFAHLTDSLRDLSPFDEIPLPATLFPSSLSYQSGDRSGGGDEGQGPSSSEEEAERGKLFLGGLAAFHQSPSPLEAARITHVLTVLDYAVQPTLSRQLRGRKHLFVQAEDESAQDLLRFFPRACGFLEGALGEGRAGRVFVHCAMGVSRSATLVLAWFVSRGAAVQEALRWVREGRWDVKPNEEFMRQLMVWERMCRDSGGWDEEVYRRWKAEEGKGKL